MEELVHANNTENTELNATGPLWWESTMKLNPPWTLGPKNLFSNIHIVFFKYVMKYCGSCYLYMKFITYSVVQNDCIIQG